MTSRDPRRRTHRYDGAVRRRQFIRWVIGGVRLFAVPTVALSLLLAVDVALPGAVEEGTGTEPEVELFGVHTRHAVVHCRVGALWKGRDGRRLSPFCAETARERTKIRLSWRVCPGAKLRRRSLVKTFSHWKIPRDAAPGSGTHIQLPRLT